MLRVSLEDWPLWLLDWGQAAGYSPTDRLAITIKGWVSTEHHPFEIGMSRDLAGTALHVLSAVPSEVPADPKFPGQWRQMWRKLLIRAGYDIPDFDPQIVALLLALKRRRSRLEFIFDTCSLVGGVGHWLCRLLGERTDLVRTAVTNYEIQGFRDRWGGGSVGKKGANLMLGKVENRFNYLAAIRFLDDVPHHLPLWRNLDLQETTVSLMRTNASGVKSPDQDTVLLHASRKAIADLLPGLHRFFVTGDVAMARMATQVLPIGATLAAYINPVPATGAYFVPYTWLPGPDEGYARTANLAGFLYEALCLCEKIEITLPSQHRLEIWGYEPDANQYPSTWKSVWLVQHPPTAPPPAAVPGGAGGAQAVGHSGGVAPPKGADGPEDQEEKASGATNALPSAPSAGSREDAGTTGHPMQQEPQEWPISPVDLQQAGERLSIPTAPQIIEGLNLVLTGHRDGSRSLNIELLDAAPRARHEVKSVLQELDLVQSDGHELGPAAVRLAELHHTRNIDGLANMILRLKAPREILTRLQDAGHFDLSEDVGFGNYSAGNAKSLLRFLGQAIGADGQLWYGGGCPGPEPFLAWIEETLDSLIAEEPMREAPISTLAQRALTEQQLSPLRFARVLEVALAGRLGRSFEPTQGGTPGRYLVDRVLEFTPTGFSIGELSADGLLGYRTLKRKNQ